MPAASHTPEATFSERSQGRIHGRIHDRHLGAAAGASSGATPVDASGTVSSTAPTATVEAFPFTGSGSLGNASMSISFPPAASDSIAPEESDTGRDYT